MIKNLSLNIAHLYGDLMNTYGDNGNILVLKKRGGWRGITVNNTNVSIGKKLKEGEFDLYFFGGGQDQSQVIVSKDLINSGKGNVLQKEVERGVPVLAICGGYQLLGEYYKPHKGPKLAGLGIFPAYTEGSNQRMIGNIVIQNSEFTLVGFENHSGKTYLKKGAKALGKVIKGFGNNREDKTEGCIYKNAIGCYMHGPLLPKNPKLADWLIQKALEVKYGEKMELEHLDDELEQKAHQAAIQKFS